MHKIGANLVRENEGRKNSYYLLKVAVVEAIAALDDALLDWPNQ